MAIQMRRGNLANYDEDKMLPGEFGVATDEKELYIAFGTGDSKKILTEDDVMDVDDALSSTSENPVQNKVINTALNTKAPIESPTFTGIPKAPTAAEGTSNTQIATTAFVKQSISKSKIWIGTCNTASSRPTKIVSVTGTGFQLVDGALLLVTFRYINEEANIKLSVGNTGEIPVYINGSEESVPRFFVWEPVLFTYQATNNRWAVVGGLDLRDKSRASYDSAVLNVSDRFYAVRQDASGYLSVCVPWEDTHGTITATDQGSGVVALSLT